VERAGEPWGIPGSRGGIKLGVTPLITLCIS
jgi:hypothetical protein